MRMLIFRLSVHDDLVSFTAPIVCTVLTYVCLSLAALMRGSVLRLDCGGPRYCINSGYCVVSHSCVIVN